MLGDQGKLHLALDISKCSLMANSRTGIVYVLASRPTEGSVATTLLWPATKVNRDGQERGRGVSVDNSSVIEGAVSR